MTLPDPRDTHPVVLPNGERDPGTVFLKQVIDHPNIEVGDYTYFNDSDIPQDYALAIAPYLFPGAPERLVIGKFCQIAKGTRFVTATANHPMAGISTYPFGVFDAARFPSYRASLPHGGDTVVGHDCWFGRDVLVLPGAELGSGVIVGAGAVVSGKVPDYAVVAGNPAKVIRMRFPDDRIAKLLQLQWWDWPPERIVQAIPAIEGADVEALTRFAETA
ncbi:MAG: CatB-related O-acetyltransferase [Kiloniellales bacterium]